MLTNPIQRTCQPFSHRCKTRVIGAIGTLALALGVFSPRVFAVDVQVFQDIFSRADNTNLGISWIEHIDGFEIVSNDLKCVSAPCGAYYANPIGYDDNYAQIAVRSLGGGQRPSLLLRYSSPDQQNGYNVQWRFDQNDILVYRVVNGSATLVGTLVGGLPNEQIDDTFKASIQTIGGDPQIEAYINGSFVGSLVDTNPNKHLTGQYTGIYNSTVHSNDNFYTGYIAQPTPTPIPSPTPTPEPPTPTPDPQATPTPIPPSPTATPSGTLGLQDESGFQFLGQIIAFTIGLIGYTVLASNLYKR